MLQPLCFYEIQEIQQNRILGKKGMLEMNNFILLAQIIH